jgi:4-hydroxybenzoate polyprenyltransferase
MASARLQRIVRVTRALVRATHAAPTATVTAVMTAFAASTGRSATGCVLVAATVLSGQLSVGWSNDYLDRFRDATVGRTDKPIPAGDVAGETVLLCAITAVLCCIPLSLANGWRGGLVHLAGVAAAWCYNLGLKATLLSPLPYAIGFGALPSFVVLGLPGRPSPPLWLVGGGALLGVGAHFANVLPDLAADAATGVVGLPHRLGRTGSAFTSAGLLLAATLLLLLGPSGGSAAVKVVGMASAVALVVVGSTAALRWAAEGSAAMFRTAMALALLDVTLLLVRGGSLG